MSQYVTFRLPNGYWAAMLFTRMHKDDSWMCQLSNEAMQDLQKMIGNDIYESL